MQDLKLAATQPEPISVGAFNGVRYTIDGPYQSPVLELAMLLDEKRIMVVGLTPANSSAIQLAMDILVSLNIERPYSFPAEVLQIASEWAQAPLPKPHSRDVTSTNAPAGTCPAGTFPGNEAPNTPISLHMPFISGETWTVGGVGSFYGNGFHCNSNNDYYATDWNRSGDDGAAVLPVANGTISGAQSPTCPSSGYGCYVRIDHASSIRTLYAHLSGVHRTSGQVSHSDQIGTVGSTGNSNGPHLHLRFQQNDGSGYHSYCYNNGSTCPNGESPRFPQSPKPSPMNTTGGSQTLIDGHSYTSNNSGGDTTPPDGDYTSPADGATITSRTVHMAAWASDNSSGVRWVRFNAKWNDQWRTVYEDSSPPYEFEWDLCNPEVPDGDVELSLHIQDNAGNDFYLHTKHANPHITKSYNCNPVQPPAAPTLSNPPNGSTHPHNYDLTFEWNSASGAEQYLIEWWGGPYDIMQPCGWTGTTSCHIGQVAPGHTYYWHARARNSGGESGWSDIWSFTIEPQAPAAPTLHTPPNGSTHPYNYDLNFEWNSVSGAEQYLIEWWGGPYDTMQPCGWTNSTSCHIGQIMPGHTYYWHVKARNNAGESGWSDTRSFTIEPLQVIQVLTLSPADPLAGEVVTAQFTAKNMSNQAITLRRLMVGVHGPNCTGWDCPHVADFPVVDNLTLQPNQEYIYTKQRFFAETGNGYFAEPLYEDTNDDWHPLGGRIEFSVSPGIQVVEALTLSPAHPLVDQIVTARYKVKNTGGRAITLRRLGVVARGPDCAAGWDCPNVLDFPAVENLTLQPNEEYIYSRQRSFSQAGSGYLAESAFEDPNGWWFPVPGSSRVNFSVSAGIQVIEALTLSPADPLAGEVVTAQFKLKNQSEQVITLRRLMVGVHGPNCADWDCPNVADFPAVDNLTLQPNQEYTYRQQRFFTETGNGYFAEPLYTDANDDWYSLGGRIEFSVSPGIQVVEALTLSPGHPLVDQTVTAWYKVKNTSGRAIILRRLGVVARGPDCTAGWDCPDVLDFPAVENLTLQPGETYTYSRQRTFIEAGGGYLAEPAFEDPNGWWFPVPGGNRVQFSVSQGIQVIQPLSLSPVSPLAGEVITAQFAVKNMADQAITLRRLMVGVHGPNCTDWDCPNVADFPAVDNLTLQPNEEYTYSQQRFFTETGNGYFAEPLYTDANDNWYPLGGRVQFSISPGIQVVEALTLSPANPIADLTVTARYKVKNTGGRAITLRRLGVVTRGPDCTAGWDCPDVLDFPAVESLTLQPDEGFTYTRQRSFTEAGSGYLAEPAFEDPNGWWFPVPGGSRIQFSVSRGVEVTQPLSLSPASPLAGEVITAEFTVKNMGDQVITLRRLMVGVHGPNCADWDCPNVADFPAVDNLTLQPNEEYTYSQQRFFTETGNGYFAEPLYVDTDDNWHPYGGRIEFSVSPGIQVVEALTLSPANPIADLTVTAQYKVKNAGGRAITLRRAWSSGTRT